MLAYLSPNLQAEEPYSNLLVCLGVQIKRSGLSLQLFFSTLPLASSRVANPTRLLLSPIGLVCYGLPLLPPPVTCNSTVILGVDQMGTTSLVTIPLVTGDITGQLVTPSH